jgi:hypothetical protein
MRYRSVARFIALLALCCLSGCGTPILTSGNLSNQVMTYSTAFLTTALPDWAGAYTPNGHDVISFTFDSTGRAGTFEEQVFSFGYATQADVTAAVYANAVWFQTGGYQGTFTYSGESCSFALAVTSVFAPKDGAAAMSNGEYAKASYEYRDIKDLWGDTASLKYSTTLLMTLDSLTAALVAKGAVWEGTDTFALSAYKGVAGTHAITRLTDMTIASDGVGMTLTETDVAGSGGTTLTTTSVTALDCSLQKLFIVGQNDAANTTFASAWKYGNKVSFQLNTKSLSMLTWEGDTKPATAPTPDPATGTVTDGGGTAGTDEWSWIVSVLVQPMTMNFYNGGSYITNLDLGTSAVRGIRTR